MIIITETVQTVKDVIDTIMPYLQQAADKLGTTAEYMWKLQVKQAYVDGITLIVRDLVFVCLLGSLILFAKFLHSKNLLFDRDGDLSGYGFGLSVAGFILIILSILFITDSIQPLVSIFVNPEYYALQHVILLLKGVTK